MVEYEATENVDYLSFEWKEEDIRATKNYICRRRAMLGNYRRLENALWRAWAKQEQKLQCSPSSLIQWYGPHSKGLNSSISLKLTFAILIRDRDTDTTWLFGPWKTNSNLQSTSSFSLLQPQESANTHFCRNDQDRGQNKRCLPAVQSILILPQPWRMRSPCKTRVCPKFRCPLKSLRFSSKLQSSATQSLPSRSITHRVYFNQEVQQVLCLPQAIYWYPTVLYEYEKQDNTLTDERNHYLDSLSAAHVWGRNVLPLPSTRLKPIEDAYQSSSSANSIFHLEDTE